MVEFKRNYHNEFVAILAEDNIAFKKWQAGRTLKAIGNLVIVPSVAFVGLGFANLNNKDEIASGLAPIMLLGGIGGSIIGVILITTGNNKASQAIDIFNSKSSVHFNLLSNGTNLRVVINLNKKKEFINWEV